MTEYSASDIAVDMMMCPRAPPYDAGPGAFDSARRLSWLTSDFAICEKAFPRSSRRFTHGDFTASGRRTASRRSVGRRLMAAIGATCRLRRRFLQAEGSLHAAYAGCPIFHGHISLQLPRFTERRSATHGHHGFVYQSALGDNIYFFPYARMQAAPLILITLLLH